MMKRILVGLLLLLAVCAAPVRTLAVASTVAQQQAPPKDDMIPEEEGDNFFILFIAIVGVGFIVIVLLLLYAFNQAGKSGFTFWRGQANRPLKKATVFTPPAAAGLADAEHHFEGGGASGTW